MLVFIWYVCGFWLGRNKWSENRARTEVFNLTLIGCQWRKFVDVFAGILAVRDAKSKVEIEAFKKSVPKIMSLNHPEVLDWLITDGKLYPKSKQIKDKDKWWMELLLLTACVEVRWWMRYPLPNWSKIAFLQLLLPGFLSSSFTYVAPTVFKRRNSDVNLYRTNRPAFGSSSFSMTSSSKLSGFAISKRTSPDSMSRILNLVKSMLKTLACGSHK